MPLLDMITFGLYYIGHSIVEAALRPIIEPQPPPQPPPPPQPQQQPQPQNTRSKSTQTEMPRRSARIAARLARSANR